MSPRLTGEVMSPKKRDEREEMAEIAAREKAAFYKRTGKKPPKPLPQAENSFNGYRRTTSAASANSNATSIVSSSPKRASQARGSNLGQVSEEYDEEGEYSGSEYSQEGGE